MIMIDLEYVLRKGIKSKTADILTRKNNFNKSDI